MTHEHADLDELIAGLAESDSEHALMRRAVDLLAYVPVETEPPASLRARVMSRVAAATRAPQFEADGSFFAMAASLPWADIAPGIKLKVLWLDPATGAQTAMVQMEPNISFPPHGHEGIEDLYVVQGDAWVGDIPMRAGDYCRATQATDHSDIRSGPAGAVAFVVHR
jgi:hypothetical protein